MALDRKLSSDILVTTLINLSQKIRGIVFIPLITRLLGTAAYGAFIQVGVVARICSKFSLCGLENALIKFAQERDDVERSRLYITLLSFVVLVSTGTGVVIFLSASLVSSLFLGSSAYISLFQIGSLLVPIYAIQDMGQNYYRSEMQIKRYSLLEGIKTYLNVGAVVFVLLVADFGLFGVVAVVVSTELTFAVGLQIMVLRSTGLSLPRFDEIGVYLRYSTPIMVGDISGMFQDRSDRLLLGFFLGADAVGIYSISYTVAKLLRMYALPLQITFFPEFSRLWEEGEQDRCYQYLSNGARYLVGLAIPSIVGLYLVGESLIGLLSTAEAAVYAPILLPVLATGIMLIGLDSLFRQLYFADGKTFVVSVLRVGGAVLNVGLNVVLIPLMGIVGAAIATLLTFLLLYSVLYWMTVRNYASTLDLSFVVKAIGSATGMLLIALVTDVQNIVVLIAVCPLIYFALMVGSKAVRPREIRFVVGTIVVPFTR